MSIGRDFVAIPPIVMCARDDRPISTRHLAEIAPNGVALCLCRTILPRTYKLPSDSVMGRDGCQDCRVIAKIGLHVRVARTP